MQTEPEINTKMKIDIDYSLLELTKLLEFAESSSDRTMIKLAIREKSHEMIKNIRARRRVINKIRALGL